MLATAVIVVLVLVAGVLAFAATRPDAFSVQRSTRIKAPPEKVFALIDDFHQWTAWSPWEKIDPALNRSYSGATSGKGAVYAWKGNSKVGEGRMEILQSSPSSKILIKLDFLKPFEGHNTAEFTLESKGGFTDVTWAMYGPNRYVAKVMSLFFSMEKMVGGSFEEGLASMKVAAEN